MDHDALIHSFYTAFAAKDIDGMLSCYHRDVTFNDPAFGTLQGDRARGMWRMLVASKDSQLVVRHSGVMSDEENGKADWTANYLFGPDRREVTNTVSARFAFTDGLILTHTDEFDLWSWSRQALGWSGALMGWSGYMRSQIQKKTNARLDAFLDQANGSLGVD